MARNKPITKPQLPAVDAAIVAYRNEYASTQATIYPVERRAWDAWAAVPEQQYLSRSFSEACAMANVRVVNGIGEELPYATLDALGSNDRDRGRFVRELAEYLYVAGTAWIVGLPRDEYWRTDFVPGAPEQVKGDASPGNLRLAPFSSQNCQPLGGDAFLVTLENGLTLQVPSSKFPVRRLWRPSPVDHTQPFSPTIGSLQILKEISALTDMVMAQAVSQQQILKFPSEVLAEINRAQGQPSDSNEFIIQMLRKLATNKSQFGNAESRVPDVIVGENQYLAGLGLLDLSSALDKQALSLRTEAIRRLAVAQDAPPKMLMATGGAGGVSSRYGFTELIRDASVRQKINDFLDLMATDLTRLLINAGNRDAGVKVIFDLSHLPVAPNVQDSALDLYDRGILNAEETLSALGYERSTEEDGDGDLV